MAIKHSTTAHPNDIVASANWNANHAGTLNHQTELTNVTANQHHNESHNAASHSDITASGADIDDAVSKKHSQNTDTALGSGCEAADHGAAVTDQVINVCYGTGDPPAANTTTEGTLFVKYTA